MKEEYIITCDELQEKGLNLSEYLVDDTLITPLINIALDIATTRMLYLNDNFYGESGIEEYLGLDSDKLSSVDKIKAFKKLQFRVIYNLVFTSETEPTDKYVDHIITYDLRASKINGFQKGIYFKQN